MDHNAFNRQIGQNLRELRKNSGLTQQDIATALGVTFQQIQKYEKGTTRLPLEALYQLRTLFGVGTDRFFAGLPTFRAGPDSIRPGYMKETCARVAKIPDPIARDKAFRIMAVLAE